ncbi:MAG: hypothetical protein ACR2QM_00275, partial [Longimicrobiales bacterium]
ALALVGLATVCPSSGMAQLRSAATTRLVLTETRAAVEFPVALPTLHELLPAASPDLPEGQGADWDASWEVGPSRGRDLRKAVYEVLDTKSLTLEPEHLRRSLDLLRRSVDGIETFQDDLPLHLSLSYREARGLLSQAESAAESTRWPEVALATLKTADALRELTPKAVALALIETAEGVLAAEAGPEAVSEENLARASRLVLWARSAVRAGSHTLAVERAYYACRLAGILLP